MPFKLIVYMLLRFFDSETEEDLGLHDPHSATCPGCVKLVHTQISTSRFAPAIDIKLTK